MIVEPSKKIYIVIHTFLAFLLQIYFRQSKTRILSPGCDNECQSLISKYSGHYDSVYDDYKNLKEEENS